MKALVLLFGIVGCGLSGCSHQSAGTLPADVTRAFEEALASDHADAVAALFTDDAEILTQERPTVKGKEDIKEYVAEQMNPMIMFDSTTDMSMVRGDLALETGSYRFRDTRRGADIESGKYMYVWKKQNDHWKLFRAMYNTDEPVNAKVTVAHESE